jgi:methylmalonyl-CoA mutase N-terminal domain/subunit
MATAPDQKPSIAPIVGPDDERRFTDSGIEIKHRYDSEDVAPNLEERLGEPGEYPFTRGIHPDMYRGRKWTMRQYAGYATAQETNERFHYLIDHGSTGLSMAFDLPTQLGRDSDDPLCMGEVGRTGVAIDTIDDMRRVFDGIPLDQVSTSMTINAPAAVLLLLYELVGDEQGVAADALTGTTQNDVLKEYIARGNFIYPPGPAMRLTTDLFAYCHERIPKWNTISISGYHMREKGCSAVQEVGFTLANAIAYVQAAIDAGLQVDEFGPRLAFFFNGHNNVFQEVAKFRAARRMWARIMRERFGAQDERSLKMRFHTQTGGVTLAAQQPHNNIVRVALQGFAAVAGGTQSLHTNGFDEALALPSETAARIALRTQQILARVRRGRHRRPVRRLLLRRGAHRRDRGGRAGADRPCRGDGRLGELHSVHPGGGRGVGLGLRGALPPEAGHRRGRERVRDRPDRRGGDPQGRPRVGAPAGRATEGVQGGPRPGGGGGAPRGAARGLPR